MNSVDYSSENSWSMYWIDANFLPPEEIFLNRLHKLGVNLCGLIHFSIKDHYTLFQHGCFTEFTTSSFDLDADGCVCWIRKGTFHVFFFSFFFLLHSSTFTIPVTYTKVNTAPVLTITWQHGNHLLMVMYSWYIWLIHKQRSLPVICCWHTDSTVWEIRRSACEGIGWAH